MNILISYLFCTKGGVETALINRLKEINTERYQVDLHFFQECGGISMFEDWNGQIFIERSTDNIKKQIIENEYDVVIAIDSKDMLDILKEMGYEGKIGLEVHTTYEKGLQYLKDKIIDIVDFVIVPSQYQKELISSRIDNKEIYVLGNAVSGNLIYNPNKKLSHDKKIILWVGRIDSHKNWRLFLKIASELIKHDDNLYFWLVGGLKSSPEEINEFEKKLYELNLECRVRWIPQVHYKQMSDIYSYVANSGGCYISTSMNESFGMTIIEAMICRCPVVVNAVGALTELVQDGRGLCISDMEVPENIERIWKFISNPNRQNIINKSQNYVIENFSCKSISRRFEQIIDNIYSDKCVTTTYDLDIWGSCVSRDIFEFDSKKRFEIAQYMARSSIVSSVEKPIVISEDSIKLESAFQKRMVIGDLTKSNWKLLKEKPAEYLLIDFIDERYELGKYDNSYFTISDEFVQSKCILDYEDVERVNEAQEYFVGGVSLSHYLDLFIKNVKECYKEENIILHRAKLVDYYISKQGKVKRFSENQCQYNKRINQLLQYMYSYMEDKLKNCISIEYDGDYYASENHIWGLEPMHYEDKYYVSIMNSLYDKLLGDRNCTR